MLQHGGVGCSVANAGLLAARRPASLWPRAQCRVRGVRCIEAFIAPASAAAESIEDVGRTMGMLTALLLIPLGSWRDHFFLAGGDGTGFKRTGDASTAVSYTHLTLPTILLV